MTILFTSDLHNRLTPAKADRLAALKAAHSALLLDGGDAVSASNVTLRLGSEPVAALMNRAGYDAMALGNREYFFRAGGLVHKTAGLEFPVLAANLELADTGGPVRPWALLQSCEVKVGVIGCAREMLSPGARLLGVVTARFREAGAAVAEAVAELRGIADMLVLLSHCGAEEDRELARRIPDLDLVLSGHSHPPAVEVERVAGTTIVRAPAYAQVVAVVHAPELARPFSFQVQEARL